MQKKSQNNLCNLSPNLCNHFNRKTQTVMESTLAYLVGSSIVIAAAGIFAWGIAHIPARWGTYWATRVLAGTPRGRVVDEFGASGGGYSEPLWPTYFVGGGVTP
jgi:hypothetical protein